MYSDITLKTLSNQLNELRTAEQQLELKIKELEKRYIDINSILIKHAEEWFNHEEKYCNELFNQLGKKTPLTETEKSSFHDALNHFNNIRKIFAELKEKYKIELSVNTPSFTVAVYGALIAALGRNLQEISEKTIKSIINELPTLKNEAEALKVLVKSFEQEINVLMAGIKKTEEELKKITELSPEIQKLLTIYEPKESKPKTTTPAPTT